MRCRFTLMSGKALCLASIMPYMLERLPPGEKIPSPWNISQIIYERIFLIIIAGKHFLDMYNLSFDICSQNGSCQVTTNNLWVSPIVPVNNASLGCTKAWFGLNLSLVLLPHTWSPTQLLDFYSLSKNIVKDIAGQSADSHTPDLPSQTVAWCGQARCAQWWWRRAPPGLDIRDDKTKSLNFSTSKVWMLVLRASDNQDPATPYSSAPWYNWPQIQIYETFCLLFNCNEEAIITWL